MDAGGAKGEGAIRGRPSRVVLTPRRRRQVGGNSFPPMTVTKKPDHRGEHEVSRKTIARGMPGNPGVTVVTTLVCFLLCTRGCGRIRRPAFPAPSEFRGQTFQPNSRENALRDRGGVPDVVARSEATKQSILQVCRVLDYFASLAMTSNS